jgi:hypothetical protein
MFRGPDRRTELRDSKDTSLAQGMEGIGGDPFPQPGKAQKRFEIKKKIRKKYQLTQ